VNQQTTRAAQSLGYKHGRLGYQKINLPRHQEAYNKAYEHGKTESRQAKRIF